MTSPSAYQRLAPFVQEFIYRQEWKELRSLQVEAIEALFDSNDDILITTGTASGKTEAAFLPILSLIQENPVGSVRVLYVGPLKALINDQFRRLEILCESGGIPIHRWHGDIGSSKKAGLIEHPGGILQITPESIESLFINKTNQLPRLFSGLQFVVVDEVHSFLESDRGVQLRSQLDRLEHYSTIRPRRVGLSATVGDSSIAKSWLNPHKPEKVLLINPDVDTSPVRLSHLHFMLAKEELPSELLDDLYSLTRSQRALIFCNSRKNVELVTSQLNRRCSRDRMLEHYLPHHGSISKDIREDAEHRMRDDDHPVSVICTNTLELGIDIGQLDLAVQIDSTHTVMSFVQRLGRTGRRFNSNRIMQIYTTDLAPEPNDEFYERIPFSLLKALAIVDLFLENWVEPPKLKALSYNVLYHQLLSRLVEVYGTSPRDLVSYFLNSGVFSGVSQDDYSVMLKYLGSLDHIEQLPDGELILGLAGEKIVRSKDFYAVFVTPVEWDVFYGERILGRITPSPDLRPGICMLLVGRLWEVKDVLPDKQQVLVVPAKDARNVLFQGAGIPDMHPRIAQRMHEILLKEEVPSYLAIDGQTALMGVRVLAKELRFNSSQIFDMTDRWIILLWTGTRSARTIQYLFQLAGIPAEFPVMLFPWVLAVPKNSDSEKKSQFLNRLANVLTSDYTIEDVVNSIPSEVLKTHKYDEFLPEAFIRSRAIEEWLDWDQATIDIHNILTTS